MRKVWPRFIKKSKKADIRPLPPTKEVYKLFHGEI
jgi:hypothetical protein